jgi:hypothetical protein
MVRQIQSAWVRDASQWRNWDTGSYNQIHTVFCGKKKILNASYCTYREALGERYVLYLCTYGSYSDR